MRYWARIVIASNPKRGSRTLGQVIGVFTANIVVSLMALSLGYVSRIMIALFPAMAPVIALFTLFIMLYMFVSLFRRMWKVNKWRYKQEEKNKPAK